ncbi:MAG: aminodeoxychorismate synthase component I [Betaproteobacteria bacterium]|nr:aminodeoxychorismate synthase component I [Betaproteobacteria bacterium]
MPETHPGASLIVVMPELPRSGPFALLENTRAGARRAVSFLFVDPVEAFCAWRPEAVPDVLAALEAERCRGRYVCGYVSFEAGYLLAGRRHFSLQKVAAATAPLLSFFSFRRRAALEARDVKRLVAAAEAMSPCAVYDIRMSEDRARYGANLDRIRRLIHDGEVYQVNHTLKYHFRYEGSPWSLYCRLRQKQSVEYAAFLDFPEVRVLSLSPELFVRQQGAELVCRPMKGTAARGANRVEDDAIRARLKADGKTRAENVMIVDLLRNDLGRLARPGSVRVDRLFEVQTFETLHQMVSTIRAQPAGHVPLDVLLSRLFPCGSVTGAPKIRALQVLEALEAEPRGIYTGALGYAAPGQDLCFNVPIRTVVSTRPGYAELGIGSGIVHESNEDDEFRECGLKAQFLWTVNDGFGLIETMRLEGGRARHLERHLERLERSAQVFGFAWRRAEVLEAVGEVSRTVGFGPWRLRVQLARDGTVECSTSPLAPPPSEPPLVTLSAEPIRADSIFQHHKTTHRDHYERAYARAAAQGAYDVLFLNEQGRLAEASRHNVFVEREGRLLTPVLESGALPGIGRALMLAREPRAGERRLDLGDLFEAERIFLCNSARGLVEVRLHPDVYEQARRAPSAGTR